MRRSASFFLLLLLLLSLLTTPALADVIRDFTYTPRDHAVDLEFTAAGYESVKVVYSNRFEKGELLLTSADGHYTCTLTLPDTYPGNNVAVTVKSDRGKELKKKSYVQTALNEIPPAEKAPSGRFSGVTVCIDPGHQGVEITKKEPMGPGLSGYHTTTNGQAQGVVTRRYESVVVLEIGLKLRNALLLEGADVVMTREDQQTAVTNVRRAEIASESGSDLFIRLHCDNSGNKNKRGIHIYCPLSSTYAKQVADAKTYRAYGEALFQAMSEATGVTRGGVTLNNSYVANNWATMPAFLIELGYMSNEKDDVMLSTEEYQENVVRGMVNGLYEVAKLRGLTE